MRASNAFAGLTINAAIHGLGGLGVIALTRLLAECLQLRFPSVVTTETRGIAQRRAPVHSIVRAGSCVRSATIPNACIDYFVILEATEALRAAPLMQPGVRCLLTDLVIPPSGRGASLPEVGSIRCLLERRGIEVIPLEAADWLRSRGVSDVLVSIVAFGALAVLAGLSVDECEQTLLRRLASKTRDDNQAAFRLGAAQVERMPSEVSVPWPDAVKPITTRS
jgi:Pyruvate/2-oxoacid:ferredoxin oxidoreductase gamma subunit